ncbi:MAG: CCA tRNA nucleotidyltransferase [Planctomycetota bacterium]|jgi:poly(A) polymerase
MTNKQAAIKVVERLCSNGFKALFAGGCVRDMLLGRRANDYDVATDAAPRDVIKLFRRTLKVGAKFGVVIVLIEKQQVEVATFRSEAGYVDGRHPAAVTFTSDVEDACRRDFTINGMFYDPIKKEVIDYVNGRGDLKSRLIRTIGKPAERFSEDYLRMLRAVRFATQLDFTIEPQTWLAICDNAQKITNISGERITMELEGILVSPNRGRGVEKLIESSLAKAVFPGFNAKQEKLAINVMGRLKRRIDFALGLAAFFVGFSTDDALEKCKFLKLSRNLNKHIRFLLAGRGRLLNDKMSLAGLKIVLAEPYFEDLYELQKAIQKAEGKSTAALKKLRKREKSLTDVDLKPKPLLNGHALIQLGAVPGPGLGQLAEEMYIAQLEGELETVEEARLWVQKWLQKHRMFEK